MDYDNGFILQKTVDWSLLNDGMAIPVLMCSLFRAWDESILTHGQSKDIKILIDGEFYDAKLKNQNFEQSNWAGHKDVIQIRYIRILKEFYGYRDEISGERIGSVYGDSVVEAHHIDYFIHSQNNDSTNIIIISPNYHRIIHKNNPRFNRKKFQFEFENGEVLRMKLFEHLKV